MRTTRRALFTLLCVLVLTGCSPVRDLWSDEGESDRPIPRSDCQRHLEECLASPLSKQPGGVYGESRCVPCKDRCKAEGKWPDKTYDGKDCRWWDAK